MNLKDFWSYLYLFYILFYIHFDFFDLSRKFSKILLTQAKNSVNIHVNIQIRVVNYGCTLRRSKREMWRNEQINNLEILLLVSSKHIIFY